MRSPTVVQHAPSGSACQAAFYRHGALALIDGGFGLEARSDSVGKPQFIVMSNWQIEKCCRRSPAFMIDKEIVAGDLERHADRRKVLPAAGESSAEHAAVRSPGSQ